MNLLDRIKTTLQQKPDEKKEDFAFNRNKKIMATTTLPSEDEIKKELAEKSL